MTTPRWTSYDVQGRLLDVSQNSRADLIGAIEDPDRDFLGWYIDWGVVRGVDVSGRCICASVHRSRDVASLWTDGAWESELLVDDRCTEQQQAALLSLFAGHLGGPMADLAVLIGAVVAVRRVRVTFELASGGNAHPQVSRVNIGDGLEARVTLSGAGGTHRSFRFNG